MFDSIFVNNIVKLLNYEIMKTRTAYLFICVLIFTLTASGQNQEINIPSSKGSETRVDLQRIIRLEKDSKPVEVMINIKQKTQRLELSINSRVTIGMLTIEVYDPNDVKQGNFTVGTQLNTDKKEMVNGNIRKSLNEPQHGNWKVKIIPSNATGSVIIQTDVVE
jgi:hypothetical protein